MKLLEPGQQKELCILCKKCVKLLDGMILYGDRLAYVSEGSKDCNRGRFYVSEVRKICQFCFQFRKAYLDLIWLDHKSFERLQLKHQMYYAIYLERKKAEASI